VHYVMVIFLHFVLSPQVGVPMFARIITARHSNILLTFLGVK